MELTEDVARKVIRTVDKGLSSGLGERKPGFMCVEAAVCYALGQEHSDRPVCVGAAVRDYKIGLNDAAWSSKTARAKGMRRVAVAQLGSDEIDQVAFVREVALETIRQVVPIALRAAVSLCADHKDALEAAAVACEVAVDLNAASDAASDAASAALAASYAALAASDAASAASYAALAASDAASDAASAALAASYAASDAASAALAASYAASDAVLSKCAEIAVQALVKLGSKGAQWLWLTEGE